MVKAFVVCDRSSDAAFAVEMQDSSAARLSQHEYPRLVAFVDELPKTPAGKVNRKALRDREAAVAIEPDRSPEQPANALGRAALFPKITDAALESLRERIGVPIENTAEPWCHEATRDNIRHYAHGIGDDNPLWCDPDYAAKTRYGGIVALPTFLFATSRIIRDMSVAFRVCTPCGRGRTGPGTSRCCATTRSGPRHHSRT